MKPRANVFVTDRALSLITPSVLKKESERLSKELGILDKCSLRIGLLIGGNTEKTKYNPALFEATLEALEKVAQTTNTSFFITSSRRTPEWADVLLKKKFQNKLECPLLVIANESNPAGVVAGILGLSNVLIVTGESISMVSEAISSMKPVVVFTPAKNIDLKPKYRKFLNDMKNEKLITLATEKNIYEIMMNFSQNGYAVPHQTVSRDHEILFQAMRAVA